MKRTELKVADYKKWADEKWIEYASQTVRHSGLRLILETNVNGDLKVIYGDDIVYEGCSIINAIEIYNAHI